MVGRLKRWLVITPEYGTVVPVLDYGQGPEEFGCDVIEIEAVSRRDALLLGVKEMRRLGCGWFGDVSENPYTGITVERL